MAKTSKAWQQRQRRDPFVRRARDDNYRGRAVYKLQEIDRRDRLFRRGQTVVDLGAAPGSWSQYAALRTGPDGRVIAVDSLTMDPIANVEFIHGDFTGQETWQACLSAAGSWCADLVISDMAPNLTGIRTTDQARSLELAEAAFELARRVLKPGGDCLVKVFEGPDTDRFRKQLLEEFQKVMVRKPKASRAGSSEFYILARGYDV